MPQHTDILDQHDSLRNPFVGSVLFHIAVAAAFILINYQFATQREVWGSASPSGGGSVAISPVATIPLPARQGRVNPVANDTESTLPAAPLKEAPMQKVRAPEPDAIPLKNKNQPKLSPQDTSNQRYRPHATYNPNQIYSTQAPAAVSPMFQKPGSPGAVGLDQNSVLGSRFGAYAALLMQRVAEKWRTNGLEGVRPVAIVSVDLLRNGSIRNIRLVQGSGNYQLDTSAQRAVTEAAPFPPLPPEYEHDVVNIEFMFRIKQ